MDNISLERTLSSQRILVTGAAGTIGSALVRHLLELGVGQVIGLDNNETGLFFLGNFLGSNFDPVLGDVRDRDKLMTSFRGVDIVFHSAALKHVPLCEHHPLEAVQTNILGVQNVIHAAMATDVKRVIYTSTDKAVNPPNVMGTSKLMGEQLIKAANVANTDQIFSSTRFGNVLGSRGSVLPLFRYQISKGGPVTLTSADMTRFVMTLTESVDLLIEAALMARGGEIFITKMATICIEDLVNVLIEELAPQYGYHPKDIPVEEIGARPGEKIYEELMTVEEVRRSIELERHFVVLPALTDIYNVTPDAYPGLRHGEMVKPYNSMNETPMSRDALRTYLRETGLLDDEKTVLV